VPDGIVIPARALFRKAGRTIVYAKQGSKYREMDVEVKPKSGDEVLIAKGIQPGTTLALKDPTLEHKGGCSEETFADDCTTVSRGRCGKRRRMPPSHCAGYGFRGSDGHGERNGSAACGADDRGPLKQNNREESARLRLRRHSCQIIELAKPGTLMHTGDVVLEFDPRPAKYNLEQNRSDLQQAEQEIAKARADAAVQTAEDKTAP